jgi:GTPase SAR1 family protein
MTRDIKITMLGSSQAGKTCYMLAMYAKMSEGVNGFTLSTDPDKDNELIDKWEKLVYEEGKDRWPKATDENFFSYYFNFEYGLTTKLMGFDWLDYRGDALKDSSSKQDVQELRQRLVNSSCVFLCISGEYLAEKTENSVKSQAATRRMNSFLRDLGTDGQKVPVVIVITKADLCKHRPKSEIIDDIKQLFSVFFEKGTGWPVMICPVSLGTELAKNRDSGLIAPINVHLPLVFAIYAQAIKDTSEAQSRLEASRSRLENVQNRHWFPKLIDRFQGVDRVESVLKDVAVEEKKFKEIQEKLNLLTKELRNGQIHIYFDGVESDV